MNMSEVVAQILGAIAAIVCGLAFILLIGFMSRCDSENAKARENHMMECVRRQCNWINGDCLCTIGEKKP